jgi:hypothetical protein
MSAFPENWGVMLHELRHTTRAACSPRRFPQGSSRSGLATPPLPIAMDIYCYLMPNMQEGAAAAVDDALRTAINKRTKDAGSQNGSNGVFLEIASSGINKRFQRFGRVAEWFKAPVLKTGVPARVPWVRIPPLPPF